MTIFATATVRRRGFLALDVRASGGVGACILFVVGICGGGIGLRLTSSSSLEEKSSNAAAKLSFFALSNFAGEIFSTSTSDLVSASSKFADGDSNISIGGDGGWSVAIGEASGNARVVAASAPIFAY